MTYPLESGKLLRGLSFNIINAKHYFAAHTCNDRFVLHDGYSYVAVRDEDLNIRSKLKAPTVYYSLLYMYVSWENSGP